VAREVASRGILVNAVAPGFIETAMTLNLPDDKRQYYLENIPLGRYGSPEDVARVIGFLASEDASYLTGQVINVDGGMVMARC
jgi:3-oxoacyl-[acyl-carrier protein] reductase